MSSTSSQQSKKGGAESDLRQRARNLFAICDKEELRLITSNYKSLDDINFLYFFFLICRKGFVAKRDMQVFIDFLKTTTVQYRPIPQSSKGS